MVGPLALLVEVGTFLLHALEELVVAVEIDGAKRQLPAAPPDGTPNPAAKLIVYAAQGDEARAPGSVAGSLRPSWGRESGRAPSIRRAASLCCKLA